MKGKGKVNCYNLAIRDSKKKKTETKPSIGPNQSSGSKYKTKKSMRDKEKIKISSRGSIRMIDQDDLRNISEMVSQTPMLKSRNVPKRMDSINLRQYIEKRDQGEDDSPMKNPIGTDSLKKSELNLNVSDLMNPDLKDSVKDLSGEDERKHRASIESNQRSTPYLSQEELDNDDFDENPDNHSLPDSENRLKRKISKFQISVQDPNKNQVDKNDKSSISALDATLGDQKEGLFALLKKRVPEFQPIQRNAWKFFLHKTASIYRVEFLIAISLLSIHIMAGIAFISTELRALFCLKAFFLLTTLLCFSSRLLHASPEQKKLIVIAIMFCDYLLDLTELLGVERTPSPEEYDLCKNRLQTAATRLYYSTLIKIQVLHISGLYFMKEMALACGVWLASGSVFIAVYLPQHKLYLVANYALTVLLSFVDFFVDQSFEQYSLLSLMKRDKENTNLTLFVNRLLPMHVGPAHLDPKYP
jgi:hypothetical protein